MNKFVICGFGCKLLESASPQEVIDMLNGYINREVAKFYYPTAHDAWNALNRAPNGVVLLGSDRRWLWTLIRTEIG